MTDDGTSPDGGSGGPAPAEAAAALVRALVQQGRTLAVAESLTGGLVAATIVAVPGASAALRGGVVAYATEVKASVLGVDAGLLARVGAVDPDVADAMAAGVARLLGADYGVATTGVAGPDPQDGHPVGEVWISVCGPRPAGPGVERDAAGPDGDGPDAGPSVTIGLELDPALGRDGIRRAALAEALDAALDHVGS
jgi:PncC family amidohydrolase